MSMAFLNNSYAYDLQSSRKRSTSTSREKSSRQSTDSGRRSMDECSQRKHIISSSSPTLETQAVTPPLPIPVSAGLPRGRANVSSGIPVRLQTGTAYDHSSIPIPFTKNTRRDSPPPSTKLMISVSEDEGRIDPSEANLSSRGAVKSTLSDSHHGVATSPSFPSHHYVQTTDKGQPPLSHPAAKLDMGSPIPPPADRNQQWPTSSQSEDSVNPSPLNPLKTQSSPNRKHHSENSPIDLPTISPTTGQTISYLDSSLTPTPSPHARSFSSAQATAGSPTTHSFGSVPGSTRSSVRRVPVPVYDQSEFAGALGVASGSGNRFTSEKSTPKRDMTLMQAPRRPRNVLRKSSITRSRESQSAPTSDSEKKAKAHRPRAKSVVLSPSRLLGGALFDVSQPLPTKALDLTPAGEVLAAYQESQRVTSGTPLRSPGSLVTVGTPDDVPTKKSPWIPQWRGTHSGEEDSTTTKHATILTKTLTRKLFAKWSQEPEARHEDSKSRSVSGVDFTGKLSPQDASEKRFVAMPTDAYIDTSPVPTTSGSRLGWPDDEDDGEGRVWEDSVGDWVEKHKLDSEESKNMAEVSSPGRLWRLVKRFSSGNLKERHTSLLHAPPPVPPLPKDFTPRRNGDTSEMPIPSSAVPETTGGLMRYITSVPSLSIPRQKRSLSKKLSSSHRLHETEPTGSPPESQFPAPQRWRSTTTRSSSPSSGTTGFFSRSRSSSTSSYGEAVPPVPSVSAARTDKQGRDKGDDLWLSRRNSGKSPKSHHKSQEDSPVGSATIPWFDMQNPVNKFMSKGKRPALPSIPTTHFPEHKPVRPPAADGTRQMLPPPVPQRNPRRPGTHSISISTNTSRKHSMPVQDASESNVIDTGGTQARPRPGAGMQGMRPRSVSDGVAIEADMSNATSKSTRSTMIFREMTAHQKHLTEQEKNEKWEDLLKRSDNAGGTLHVGSPTTGGLTLWSDRSSTAASITLDQF